MEYIICWYQYALWSAIIVLPIAHQKLRYEWSQLDIIPSNSYIGCSKEKGFSTHESHVCFHPDNFLTTDFFFVIFVVLKWKKNRYIFILSPNQNTGCITCFQYTCLEFTEYDIFGIVVSLISCFRCGYGLPLLIFYVPISRVYGTQTNLWFAFGNK